MLDLDRFKSINDRFGHSIGDEVLKRVGTAVRATVPSKQALSCRLGGEEFAILLAHRSLREVKEVVDKLRKAIAGIASAMGVDGLETSASIGIAGDPTGSGDLSAALTRADAALYRAKRAGRDRVEIAVALADSRARTS